MYCCFQKEGIPFTFEKKVEIILLALSLLFPRENWKLTFTMDYHFPSSVYIEEKSYTDTLEVFVKGINSYYGNAGQFIMERNNVRLSYHQKGFRWQRACLPEEFSAEAKIKSVHFKKSLYFVQLKEGNRTLIAWIHRQSPIPFSMLLEAKHLQGLIIQWTFLDPYVKIEGRLVDFKNLSAH